MANYVYMQRYREQGTRQGSNYSSNHVPVKDKLLDKMLERWQKSGRNQPSPLSFLTDKQLVEKILASIDWIIIKLKRIYLREFGSWNGVPRKHISASDDLRARLLLYIQELSFLVKAAILSTLIEINKRLSIVRE